MISGDNKRYYKYMPDKSNAHLTENCVKDVYVRRKIDSWWSVIGEFLISLPLIIECIQLHPHVRCVTLPVRTIATFLIRGYFKPSIHRCPLYFRRARLLAFFSNLISLFGQVHFLLSISLSFNLSMQLC